MPDRIMFVQLKTGYDTDAGPSWIASVRFSKSWSTVYFHGRTLRRVTGTAYANYDSNFYDVESGEGYWVSGPKRDRTDARYSNGKPTVEDDARVAYEAFLNGEPLPGRERG
ncbi:hypothetical protein ABC270_16590 [Curtobacterium sp. 1P10AnD]|uniref:hypothetical protein n=1 Tax=Curtobacterium sp. 1P10AnD TaxID=3132283 RepID=UPI0039A1A3C9